MKNQGLMLSVLVFYADSGIASKWQLLMASKRSEREVTVRFCIKCEAYEQDAQFWLILSA